MKQFTATCKDDGTCSGLSLTSEVGLNNDGSPAFLDEFQPQFPGQEVLLQEVTRRLSIQVYFLCFGSGSDFGFNRIQDGQKGHQKPREMKKFQV
jgi:hypothetical protein